MPKTFTDNQGNDWTLELTLGKAREVRGKLNIDLFNEADWQTLMSSLLDRLTFVFYLVAEQARERNVSIDDFDRALIGPGIPDRASDAFLDELVFFYQELGQTKLAKLSKAFRDGTTKERQKFEELDFDKMLAQTLNG